MVSALNKRKVDLTVCLFFSLFLFSHLNPKEIGNVNIHIRLHAKTIDLDSF